jgi:hypothetical protein
MHWSDDCVLRGGSGGSSRCSMKALLTTLRFGPAAEAPVGEEDPGGLNSAATCACRDGMRSSWPPHRFNDTPHLRVLFRGRPNMTSRYKQG